MKKIISIFMAILVVALLIPTVSASVPGNTYYIDNATGNDNNDGLTQSTAWKSLSKASSVSYSQGDKILLKAGQIHSGVFIAQGSGSQSYPITLSSFGDVSSLGDPIIRTDNDEHCIQIHNVSYWIVDGIDFTAPNGSGMYIYADGNGMTEYITIKNCNFSEISNKIFGGYSGKTPILINSNGETARVRSLTIQGCNFNNCGYGISMQGITCEWAPQMYVSPEVSYNRDFLIEDCTFTNILYDAVIIGSVCGMVIRNCALLDTCLREDYFTAPMWSHHADNFVIENCEIGGALNTMDGMAVDFDGWTTNATYQYVYSHDNVRFINNCLYDNYTKNDNCTVRYCLSVNDNKRDNNFCQVLSSGSVDYKEDQIPVNMTNFKFYNNTIINSASNNIQALEDAIIVNNIFTGKLSTGFIFNRKHIDDDGNPYYTKFDGIMSNNCFWGTPVPQIGENNFATYPGFTGTDVTSKFSFRLSEDSPLIGKGINVFGNDCKTDFFGNEIGSTHNIGCYDGTGEQEKADISVFDLIWGYINIALGSIYNFIETCNNVYWLF